MTRREQKIKTLRAKQKAERKLRSMLAPWIKDIALHYRSGQTTLDYGKREELKVILNRFYPEAAKYVLSFDLRQHKMFYDFEIDQMVEDIKKAIAGRVTLTVRRRVDSTLRSVTDTAESWVRRISDLAIVNNWTEQEARQALLTHLRNQSLIVSTTESNFIINEARRSAVVIVQDPLKNSIIRITELIENGERNAARKLSDQVMRLTQLPLSEGQGELIRELSDDRSALMTPLVQGEVLANLRENADRLGATKKYWSAIMDDATRETHAEADGQERDIQEPFEVGGSLLQYPGDASLGADLSEIINCRCAEELV